MKLELQGWEKAAATLQRAALRLPAAVREVVAAEGDNIAELVRGHLQDGEGMAPLSPLSATQGRPPLSGLARNVQVRQVGDATIVAFTGTSSRGLAADALAALHARGAAFGVVATRGQQRFLMALLRERGALPSRVGQRPNPPGTQVAIKIRIPPRDVLGAAARAALEPSAAAPRIARALAVSLDGALGDGR